MQVVERRDGRRPPGYSIRAAAQMARSGPVNSSNSWRIGTYFLEADGATDSAGTVGRTSVQANSVWPIAGDRQTSLLGGDSGISASKDRSAAELHGNGYWTLAGWLPR